MVADAVVTETSLRLRDCSDLLRGRRPSRLVPVGHDATHRHIRVLVKTDRYHFRFRSTAGRRRLAQLQRSAVAAVVRLLGVGGRPHAAGPGHQGDGRVQ